MKRWATSKQLGVSGWKQSENLSICNLCTSYTSRSLRSIKVFLKSQIETSVTAKPCPIFTLPRVAYVNHSQTNVWFGVNKS